jgi:hypothetical protein
MFNALTTALLFVGTVAQANEFVLVPNTQSGVKVCVNWLEYKLNAKGKITVKETETAGLFFIDGNIVGQMIVEPSDSRKAICEILED